MCVSGINATTIWRHHNNAISIVSLALIRAPLSALRAAWRAYSHRAASGQHARSDWRPYSGENNRHQRVTASLMAYGSNAAATAA